MYRKTLVMWNSPLLETPPKTAPFCSMLGELDMNCLGRSLTNFPNPDWVGYASVGRKKRSWRWPMVTIRIEMNSFSIANQEISTLF